MSNAKFSRLLICAILLCQPVLLRVAWSINIIPVFNAGASASPSFDPTGSGLISLFEYAESYYQDVFEDPNHTLTLNIWYADIDGRGLHSRVSTDAAGRVNESNIRIDTVDGGSERNWFIDPTPADDSEYFMQQILWRDLSSTERSDYYNFSNSNALPTFEAGYVGTAANLASPAGMGVDMLSTVLHEVGHALGLTGTTLNDNETNDLDYDFDPDFVFGQSLAAEVLAPDNRAHLASPYAIMKNNSITWPPLNSNTGSRKRPSHTDLFSMASVNQYTDLDVPRREFYGGSSWGADGNWSGNQEPGSLEVTYVRHGGTATLNSNKTVDSLFIDGGSTVFTGANRLAAVNSIAVQQTAGASVGFLSVPAGGEVAADLIFVNTGGRVIVTGGMIDGNDITVALGGLISGHGTVNVSDPLGRFINDGRLAAVGGTLTIESDNNVPLDLDGILEGGDVDAIGGDVVFNVGLFDTYNGTATVGANRSIAFNSGVSIGAGGSIVLDGTAASPATVSGNIGVGFNGVVRTTGRGIVNGPISIGTGGAVSTLDSSTRISLQGFTTLQGGSILGDGRVDQNGDVVVTQNSNINVETYNMDGTGNTTITVNPGRTLNVNSTSIEDAGDGFDGTLNINNATVDIDAAWSLEGTVNFNDVSTQPAVLEGSGGITMNGGTMNFNGGVARLETALSVNDGTFFVDADVEFEGPSTFGVNTSIVINDVQDSLRLRGDTVFVNPSIIGSGRLILEDNINVAFFDTSIGTAETDLDGITGNTSIRINSGRTFSISSSTIEPTDNDGFDGTILNEGTFSVLAGWRLDGTLNMNPIGPNTSTLSGFGPFEIHSTGTLNADDTVVINPNTTVGGTINVNSGLTSMGGVTEFRSGADVEVAAGAELELNGPTEFRGGSYQGDGAMQWDGPVTVSQTTTLNLATVDMDGTNGTTAISINNSVLTLNVDNIDLGPNRFDGTIDINATLAGLRVNLADPNSSWQMNGTLNTSGGFPFAQTTLSGSDVLVSGTMNMDGFGQIAAAMNLSGTINMADANTLVQLAGDGHVIQNTATVTGLGRLQVLNQAALQLHGGVSLDVDLQNGGRLSLGVPTGIASVSGDFDQFSTGELQVELGGDGINEYDLLQVTGTAELAGDLVLSLIDDFVPDFYDPVSVMVAVGGVDGMFETIDGAQVSSTLGLAVTYGANSVDVQAALMGDANLDGTVDGLDFTTWSQNKFACGKSWVTGDFNGDGCTDGTDFLAWNLNKFATVGAAVPEAAPCLPAIVFLSMLFLRRRSEV